MLGNRILRISVAGTLLASALYTVGPHVVTHVSTNAVVNAPIVSIRSPFDGHVVTPAGDISTVFERGDVLFRVEMDRASTRALSELEARKATAVEKISVLRQQKSDLTQLRQQLVLRHNSHVDHAGRWIAALVTEANAGLAAAEARRSNAEKDLDRMQRLRASGAISEVVLQEAVLERDDAAAKVAQERAKLDRVLSAQAGLQASVPLPDGGDGLGYLLAQIDQIDLRLSDVTRDISTVRADLRGVQRQIDDLRSSKMSDETFQPRAKFAGVVWKSSSPRGTPLLTGDEVVRLLDCDRRFVEVYLDERHYERITPGKSAKLRLKGSREWIDTSVSVVFGPGNRIDRPVLAANPEARVPGHLSVFLELPPADIAQKAVAQSFCDIGRTAEVRFEKENGFVAEAMTKAEGWLTAARGIDVKRKLEALVGTGDDSDALREEAGDGSESDRRGRG